MTTVGVMLSFGEGEETAARAAIIAPALLGEGDMVDAVRVEGSSSVDPLLSLNGLVINCRLFSDLEFLPQKERVQLIPTSIHAWEETCTCRSYCVEKYRTVHPQIPKQI